MSEVTSSSAPSHTRASLGAPPASAKAHELAKRVSELESLLRSVVEGAAAQPSALTGNSSSTTPGPSSVSSFPPQTYPCYPSGSQHPERPSSRLAWAPDLASLQSASPLLHDPQRSSDFQPFVSSRALNPQSIIHPHASHLSGTWSPASASSVDPFVSPRHSLVDDSDSLPAWLRPSESISSSTSLKSSRMGDLPGATIHQMSTPSDTSQTGPVDVGSRHTASKRNSISQDDYFRELLWPKSMLLTSALAASMHRADGIFHPQLAASSSITVARQPCSRHVLRSDPSCARRFQSGRLPSSAQPSAQPRFLPTSGPSSRDSRSRQPILR